MNEQIALMIDSGCDLSDDLIRQYGIFTLPVKIGYGDEIYSDGVDIEPETVYARFPAEIPKTSMPNAQEVADLAQKIKAAGYGKVIAICMSSALSGTFHIVKTVLEETEGLESYVFDTKNISIGSGVFALWTAKQIQAGIAYDDIIKTLEAKLTDSKVFFYMDTLDYLKAGGRIGRVTGAVATVLNIKPVISCSESGVYHTVSMIRGKKNGLAKLLESVVKFAEKDEVWLSVMHGNGLAEAKEIAAQLKKVIKKGTVILEKQINASLAVHTGPGLVGVGVFKV